MYCVKVETRGHILRLEGSTDPIRTPCTILIKDDKIDSIKGMLDNLLLKYSFAKINVKDSDIYEKKQQLRKSLDKKKNTLSKKIGERSISFSGKIKRG
jgi:hypothetical protein